MRLPDACVLPAAMMVLALAAVCCPGQEQPADPTAPAAPPSEPASPTAPEEPADATDEELIQLTFPENLEVKVLVEYVSRRLGLNILYEEGKVRKQVTIISPTKIPRDSLLGFLQSVLKMTGLALVDADQPGWKRIVDSQDLLSASRAITEEPADLASAPPTAVMTRQFALTHATTAQVDQMVRPLLSKPGGNTFAIADRRVLFVTDYADVLRRVAPLVALLDQPGPEATLRFVPVEHWAADELAKRVTSLLAEKDRVAGRDRAARGAPGALTLTTEPRTNQIVVVSAGEPPEDVLALIRTLDVAPDVETHTYRLSYVAPQRLDRLAREFAETADLKGPYRSTLDAESGLLVVRASPAVHEHLAQLVTELDVTQTEAQGHVRFYKLLNTTASQVLATIRSLESGTEGWTTMSLESLGVERPTGHAGHLDEPFTGPNYPPPAVGEERPRSPAYRKAEAERKAAEEAAKAAKTGEGETPSEDGAAASPQSQSLTARTKDAVVTADPNTNTLIVVAPPPVQRVYERLIGLLDKRRPQVMVEMTMVTLDTSNNFSLGIEVAKADGVGDKGRYLTFSAFGLSEIDMDTGALTLEPGVGFNGVILDPDTVNIVMRAMASSGQTKVLASPRVLVNDNATATLSSINEAPFTSINASTTTDTTTFAGYASAGTTITVTPHISEGDHLLLDYALTLNSFTGDGAAGIPPPRQTNSISSNITVPDGYTVVVGGLTREDTGETVSKIPLLGDIPVIRHLFRSVTDNKAHSTLYVFIRPVVLRDDRFEDLKYLSGLDRDLAGLPADFPASEPLVTW